MKKKFKYISFFIVMIVMAFLIMTNYTGDSNNVEVVTSENYTVTIYNINQDAGSATIAYKENDTYIDTNKTSFEVKAGTKIKAYFKDGLKDGYSIYMWGSEKDGYIVPTMDTTDNTIYYTNESYAKTINNDFTLYVIATCPTDNITFYYNSSVKDRNSIVAIEMNTKGNYKASAPKQQGFDFVKWEVIDFTTTMTRVYPTYTANVWTVFRDYWQFFLKGLGVTLLLSVVSVFLALFLGVLVCLLRLSNITILKYIATAYVEIIRGVPLLLQLLTIYVILGPTKIHIGTFFTTEVIACILALFINSGAYSSEIFRSGIQAVDKGQMEAGRALGMSKWTVMKKIIIPQGIKNSLPSIVNELVAMIKETSLAVSVDASIGELMSVRKNITAATYINLPPYIIVAIIYFIVTFSLSKVVGLIEKRLASHDR